jgi:hypothetical protein
MFYFSKVNFFGFKKNIFYIYKKKNIKLMICIYFCDGFDLKKLENDQFVKAISHAFSAGIIILIVAMAFKCLAIF